jgi:hypothetical protein
MTVSLLNDAAFAGPRTMKITTRDFVFHGVFRTGAAVITAGWPRLLVHISANQRPGADPAARKQAISLQRAGLPPHERRREPWLFEPPSNRDGGWLLNRAGGRLPNREG